MDLQHTVSICFLIFILLFVFFIRLSNKWHTLAIIDLQTAHKIVLALTLLSTILLAVLPMSLSPYWNGSVKKLSDKQQYDRMGDALLQGHLYIDNGDIDPLLEAMDNPYNKEERERLDVKFHWDEAYYNHHYYMYFGIVPTVIIFIPFKLLTGTALLSYQATQIFAVLAIIGMFYLFYMLCRSLFQKLPFSLFLLLSSSFSILSIGYSISAPALYCTAIVSAICLMVWSIICFIKGAWLEHNKEISMVYLVIGSLLGALAFGCRPPVALANIVLLAVIRQILKTNYETGKEKVKSIVQVLLPYIFVGIILMFYNYARFDNVFEFGQSYQLTLADQHNYGSFSERLNLKELLTGLLLNFGAPVPIKNTFPFLQYSGVFISYPVLLLSVRLFANKISATLKAKNLYFVLLLLFLGSFIIALLDVYWSPFLAKRYHLDFQYLLCIVTFTVIAAWVEIISENRKKALICCIVFLAFYVFVAEFLFFCVPFDGNYAMYYPEAMAKVYKGLRFGL